LENSLADDGGIDPSVAVSNSRRGLLATLLIVTAVQLAAYVYNRLAFGPPSCNVYCGPGGVFGLFAGVGIWIIALLIELVVVIVAFAQKAHRPLAVFCAVCLLTPVLQLILVSIPGLS
jgi:hypothetical protein